MRRIVLDSLVDVETGERIEMEFSDEYVEAPSVLWPHLSSAEVSERAQKTAEIFLKLLRPR